MSLEMVQLMKRARHDVVVVAVWAGVLGDTFDYDEVTTFAVGPCHEPPEDTRAIAIEAALLLRRGRQ
jgi:hypothetical protein